MQLEPLQQASVHLALAKAVCTLYKSYLRLHGADVKGSPFAKDVVRACCSDFSVHLGPSTPFCSRSWRLHAGAP